jgi:hypothetical protein
MNRAEDRNGFFVALLVKPSAHFLVPWDRRKDRRECHPPATFCSAGDVEVASDFKKVPKMPILDHVFNSIVPQQV